MLEINYTVFVQIANFLLLLFFLNILLFKPIRGILSKRKEDLARQQKAVEDLLGMAERDRKAIEEGMAKARKEGFLQKEGAKSAALDQEKGIMQEAVGKVEDRMTRAAGERERQVAAVKKGLETEIATFSKELAEKLLGRSLA